MKHSLYNTAVKWEARLATNYCCWCWQDLGSDPMWSYLNTNDAAINQMLKNHPLKAY